MKRQLFGDAVAALCERLSNTACEHLGTHCLIVVQMEFDATAYSDAAKGAKFAVTESYTAFAEANVLPEQTKSPIRLPAENSAG